VFTGIVEETGKVVLAQAGNLVISASRVLAGTKNGDSIAVNGVCLTVTGFNDNSFSVDIMPETMERTNLGRLNAGDRVNLERALALGERLGGHLVQGHVDTTGRVYSIVQESKAMLIKFQAPPEVMHFIVPKGFIAVDGASLTVVSRDDDSFRVSLVGYTQQHTNLSSRQAGDYVNLEVDIIAKYVEQLNVSRSTGITTDFLQEHGFLIK